jgi:hypothetical protein
MHFYINFFGRLNVLIVMVRIQFGGPTISSRNSREKSFSWIAKLSFIGEIV